MAASYWDSTQHRFWEFTKEQLADIRQRKLDEERSLVQVYPLPEWRHLFIFFNSNLIRLSKRMQIRQQAIATAQVYLKRFYCKVEIRRTNPYLAMATALYLACKTEECPQHIRQVVQEAKNTWPDMHCLEIPRLGECEFFMISELSSHLIVHAPYRTLQTLQAEMGLSTEEFLQAWQVVNDHYMTDLPLLYPPHVVAVAAVIWVLVLQTPAAGAAGSTNANGSNGSNGGNNGSASNAGNAAGNTNTNNISTGIGMGTTGSMTPNSLNSYNLNGIGGGFGNVNNMSSNMAGMNNMNMGMGGMNMNMGMNMGMGGMNMSMGMNMGSMGNMSNMSSLNGMGLNNMNMMGMGQNGGAPGIGGTQSALPPPPSLHMSLSSLSAQGSNNNNTPGGNGNGTPGGGPGTPGLAGTPTTSNSVNARAAPAPSGQNTTTEETPTDGGRGATLQWLFRWLTDSGLDLEATIDCTQEMLSFYMANEEYSEKQTREQVHRFIKARGLDR